MKMDAIRGFDRRGSTVQWSLSFGNDMHAIRSFDSGGSTVIADVRQLTHILLGSFSGSFQAGTPQTLF